MASAVVGFEFGFLILGFWLLAFGLWLLGLAFALSFALDFGFSFCGGFWLSPWPTPRFRLGFPLDFRVVFGLDFGSLVPKSTFGSICAMYIVRSLPNRRAIMWRVASPGVEAYGSRLAVATTGIFWTVVVLRRLRHHHSHHHQGRA